MADLLLAMSTVCRRYGTTETTDVPIHEPQQLTLEVIGGPGRPPTTTNTS